MYLTIIAFTEKKVKTRLHARAHARADQFTHILRAGSIPRMIGQREIVMKLLSALAVGLLLAAPVSGQDLDKGLAAARAGDYETALQEFKPLAEQGNAQAQYNMGVMYFDGLGVLQDYLEASKWYHLSAEQGYLDAQSGLGMFYEKGLHGSQDYLEALKWYRLAAAQGALKSGLAQRSLAEMYEKGVGVPQDNVTAHMWFNISATTSGSTSFSAFLQLDLLALNMSADQILEAQRRARVCMASNYQDCD